MQANFNQLPGLGVISPVDDPRTDSSGPGNATIAGTEATQQILVCAVRAGKRQLICDDVQKRGLSVSEVGSVAEARDKLRTGTFSACIIDDPDTTDGVRELGMLIGTDAVQAQLICLVDRESAWGREILPSFPCEIVQKPYTAARIGSALFAAVERGRLVDQIRHLQQQFVDRSLPDIVGISPAIQSLRETIRVAADDESTVLVRGEPGSDATLVAQGLHGCSCRSPRPFIRIDCSLHTAESMERHLFGSGVGVSTIEDIPFEGYLSLADGGTLLLDNVDCVALPFQRRLVKLLESGQYVRPGTGESRSVNIRFVISTQTDLSQAVAEGQFREDLYKAINGISIQIPPLRVRREDILLVADHFLREIAISEGRPVCRLSDEAAELLQGYDWPVNSQELRNVINRISALEPGQILTREMIQPWLTHDDVTDSDRVIGMTLREMERKLIETTFARCQGNRERTAGVLKIGLRTLSGKLREYGYPPRGGPGSNVAVARKRAA